MNLIRSYLLLAFIAISIGLYAQSTGPLKPVANFSFNDKSALDDATGHKAKLACAYFIKDRFGNEDNAVYIAGNEHSYVNLGNYKELKPRAGTISLWINALDIVWSGAGYKINPILITKSNNDDNFFEAYGINMGQERPCFAVNMSRDSTKQVVVVKPSIELLRWYHVVIAFDDDTLYHYVDGKLCDKQGKKFITHYAATDSVLLGVSANKKNNRFFRGAVDDVQYFDRVLSAEEIETLYEAPNPNKIKIIMQQVIKVVGAILLLLLVYLGARWQVNASRKKEREKLLIANDLLETKLRLNRALINPHFIYNSLYSIQSLILRHDIEQANLYLVKFSRLLRKTLEGNLSDTIPLEDEMELLCQFIDIENLKYDGAINSSVKAEGFSSLALAWIPVMMVQPFVENAIWHGLKNKEGEKRLSILFKAVNHMHIECTIEDNGTGRRPKPAHAAQENKSLGIGFIEMRLELMNKLYGLNCSLNIVDKPGNGGTLVVIKMPVFGQEGMPLNADPVQ